VIDFILNTARQYQDVLLVIGIVSFVLFLVSLIVVPIIIINLPADHFIQSRKKKKKITSVYRAVFHFFKNLLGIFFLALGVILLILPGPGWLTILVGVALLDFPFKHKLEMKILSLPLLRKTIDRYRLKHNKAPLEIPKE
jgi:hypothetical protein